MAQDILRNDDDSTAFMDPKFSLQCLQYSAMDSLTRTICM
jgi:hypothetical protein